MDKVANRSIRRVLQILGKMVDDGASTSELSSVLRSGAERTAHMDLSKPIWERLGFSTKDDLLQSWRDSKAHALKEFPESAPKRPGLWQNISDFIYRVRHGHRRLNPATPPAEYMRQAYKHPVLQTKYGPYVGTRGRTTTSADYTPVINDYLERVSTNHNGRGVLGRYRDLTNRYIALNRYTNGTLAPLQRTVLARTLSPYEAASKGNNLRLEEKLQHYMERATGSKTIPDDFFSIFPYKAGPRRPGSGILNEFQMPVVTAFRAQGPFATTGHVMDGDITRGFSEKVNEAVNKLNERGTPVTHRNIKNMLAEDGVDYTKMTLHSGRTYPDKMVDNYAHVFDADAKPTRDYESVFKAGDPNAPIPEQNYIVEIPDSTIRDRQFEVINRSGMGHILKRPTVSLYDAQGTSDLRLLKGTPYPVRSVFHSTPGDPYIDNLLERALDPDAVHELRSSKNGILYNNWSPNALNNTIGTKGAKFDANDDFWYSPRIGSSTGYALKPHNLTIYPEAAKGVRLIPVTSEELDALHHVADVKDILAKMPTSVLDALPGLVSQLRGMKASTRMAHHMNYNIDQLKAAIKAMAEGKGINNGIGKAITRNSKFKDAGIDVDSEYAINDGMFKEVLGDRW